MHRRWICISWSSSQIEIWRGPLVICHPVTDLTSKLDSLLIPPIVANCRTISELWKRDPNPWFCGLTYVYLGAYSVRISVLHLHPSVSSTELNQAKSARYAYSTLYRYVINDMARQVPTAHFSLSTSHPPPGPPLVFLIKKKKHGATDLASSAPCTATNQSINSRVCSRLIISLSCSALLTCTV